MRLVLFSIALLLAAVLATLYAIENPGYVLIARAPWSVEMPLTVFIPLLLVAFVALYLLLFLLVRLLRIPRDVARWRTRRHARQGRTSLVEGLTQLAEGSWIEAEAALLAGLRYSEAPLINYLGAALAAQELGDIDKRDQHLASAHKSTPQDNLAVGMMQALLQQRAHQAELALATLADLRSRLPKHKQILRQLAQVYRDLRDWTSLIELIPDLRATSALPTEEIDALELVAHRELLTLPLPPGAMDVLQRAWNAVPKSLRRHPLLVGTYARQLLSQGDTVAAETLLRAAIDREWDERLVELYGQARARDVAEQLETAEGWLHTHPDSPALLLTLGRLAREQSLTSKAQTYLEKCIVLHGPVEAYLVLGQLFESVGNTPRAQELYRRALETVASAPRPGRAPPYSRSETAGRQRAAS